METAPSDLKPRKQNAQQRLGLLPTNRCMGLPNLRVDADRPFDMDQEVGLLRLGAIL